MRIAICFCLFFLTLGGAAADPIAIETEGSGMTRDAAVAKALVSAVEQVTGVTIDSSQISSTLAVNTVSGESKQADIVQATQDQIARSANGRISTYEVESVSPVPEGGYLAQVRVSVEVFRAKGISNADRRRIAVAQFLTSGENSTTGAALHDKLLQFLTQSRRFAVVDRSNDQVYAREMALVTGADAAPAERVRAGQVLGADYVVTGHIRVHPATTTGAPEQTTYHTLELTGEVVSNTTPSTLRTIPGSLTADFEVIEIATRQIKFADQIVISGSAVDELAEKIAVRITSAIFPPRLIEISDTTALIINQGGAGMRVGERFRIMKEGVELFDPYTHESLGRKEAEIGIVEIENVDDKVSYAKLISGTVSGEPDSLVLRPLASSQTNAAKPAMKAAKPQPASPDARDIRNNDVPDNGLKLPFDH